MHTSQADTPQVAVHPDVFEVMAWLDTFTPALKAELRSKPTLVCEGDPDPKPDPAPDPSDPKPDPKPDPKNDDPPWGDDFDPERAWKLVQGLREDNSKKTRENEDLRGKVKSHEDASKSDTEKLEERATGAETRATKAEQEAARLRVALRKGLTETQAKRLVGETEEDLEKDAEDLLESFKSDDDDEGQEPGQRRPKERLRPGAAPGAKPEETDPAKLAAAVPRRW